MMSWRRSETIKCLSPRPHPRKRKGKQVPPSSWVTVRSLVGVAKIIESFQSQVPSKKLSNGVRHSSSYSSNIDCHSSEPSSLLPDHFMPYRCDWDRSHTRWSTETTIRDAPVSHFRGCVDSLMRRVSIEAEIARSGAVQNCLPSKNNTVYPHFL
jgi:hypothetical protein